MRWCLYAAGVCVKSLRRQLSRPRLPVGAAVVERRSFRLYGGNACTLISVHFANMNLSMQQVFKLSVPRRSMYISYFDEAHFDDILRHSIVTYHRHGITLRSVQSHGVARRAGVNSMWMQSVNDGIIC